MALPISGQAPAPWPLSLTASAPWTWLCPPAVGYQPQDICSNAANHFSRHGPTTSSLGPLLGGTTLGGPKFWNNPPAGQHHVWTTQIPQPAMAETSPAYQQVDTSPRNPGPAASHPKTAPSSSGPVLVPEPPGAPQQAPGDPALPTSRLSSGLRFPQLCSQLYQHQVLPICSWQSVHKAGPETQLH